MPDHSPSSPPGLRASTFAHASLGVAKLHIYKLNAPHAIANAFSTIVARGSCAASAAAAGLVRHALGKRSR